MEGLCKPQDAAPRSDPWTCKGLSTSSSLHCQPLICSPMRRPPHAPSEPAALHYIKTHLDHSNTSYSSHTSYPTCYLLHLKSYTLISLVSSALRLVTTLPPSLSKVALNSHHLHLRWFPVIEVSTIFPKGYVNEAFAWCSGGHIDIGSSPPWSRGATYHGGCGGATPHSLGEHAGLLAMQRRADPPPPYHGEANASLPNGSETQDPANQQSFYSLYANLPPGSLASWEDLAKKFHSKFFYVDECLTMLHVLKLSPSLNKCMSVRVELGMWVSTEGSNAKGIIGLTWSNWRQPCIDFLLEDNFTEEALEGQLLKCLASSEIPQVLDNTHEAKHQEAMLFQYLLHVRYYWPTMEADAKDYVRRCKACQVHGNMIHSPIVDLWAIGTPWPFHTWAMDLINPVNPPSWGNIWIVTAIEKYTKWVEAIPLKRAARATISNFIHENITCKFGFPKVILSDNGTPFVNSQVGQVLASYYVTHHKVHTFLPLREWTGGGYQQDPYQDPKQNLGKLQEVENYKQDRSHALPMVLWAYCTSKRSPTRMTPFSLVDLVLKAAPHVMRGTSASKFAAKWEGPYIVKEVNENGYYRISKPSSNTPISPINAKWLKAYHP
ncbi:hypothetical protein Acr_17g0000780 [Actinidia rufa]|uniref:Integrase catalytic domain-containing protein n=1 Tax=Actinidia rufa TaxID=165716 RepID=A0A7J0G0Q0_9ERIC|nr:hypothetical protein Acr_17g0000780 [Actinidia rufa]